MVDKLDCWCSLELKPAYVVVDSPAAAQNVASLFRHDFKNILTRLGNVWGLKLLLFCHVRRYIRSVSIDRSIWLVNNWRSIASILILVHFSILNYYYYVELNLLYIVVKVVILINIIKL